MQSKNFFWQDKFSQLLMQIANSEKTFFKKKLAIIPLRLIRSWCMSTSYFLTRDAAASCTINGTFKVLI